MNSREHYELWIISVKPNINLRYNSVMDYYIDDLACITWQAWKRARSVKPTDKGRITKERLAELKADTSEIVDNLRGIYVSAVTPYPVSPLQKKAADVIERLREEIRILREGNDAR